jgi:hypothetical protein
MVLVGFSLVFRGPGYVCACLYFSCADLSGRRGTKVETMLTPPNRHRFLVLFEEKEDSKVTSYHGQRFPPPRLILLTDALLEASIGWKRARTAGFL